MLTQLNDPSERQELDGKRVHYRVRWARGDVRVGTIARVKAMTLFIGCFCFSHADIVSMEEVQ